MRFDLSCPRLGPFFEPRHVALAEGLPARILDVESELRAGPLEAARVMGRAGADLYSQLVPETFGGASVGRPEDATYIDVRSLVLIREALCHVSPMADSIFAVQGLGSYPVAAFGDAAMQKAVLPNVLTGKLILGFGLTEPEAGSDVSSLRTRAIKDGDEYVLSGEKTLISNIGIADKVVVFATVDPALGRKGITAFLVDTDAPGMRCTALPMSSPHPLGAIRMDGVRVPTSRRIGDEGKGFSIAMQTLDAFRISVGGAANGMAARALALAIDRVSTRVQFGAPLSDREQVQAYVAEMATDLDAARLLVARAAHLRDTSMTRVTVEAAMAKMFSTEAAERIIDKAVQLFGGSGVLLGSEVEALYRDIRPLRIYEGTTEIQRIVIARGLFGQKG